ncbi:hypothetical protein BFJ67_g12900 [Fusarium oxysporum f. sp. cepae]|nr:hypothetical protein BFJ67_g12900 [Fusarium oxysporum f. sp. cepae]
MNPWFLPNPSGVAASPSRSKIAIGNFPARSNGKRSHIQGPSSLLL